MNKIVWVFTILALGLSACSSSSTPTPIPTIMLDDISAGDAAPVPRGSVTASGVVVPAQEAHLAFIVGGNVKTVHVSVGDKVQAGTMLIELDNTLAQLDVEQARRVLRELTSPASVAAAERAVAAAQKDMEDAQNKVYALDYPRASKTKLDEVKSDLAVAKERLTLASDAYRQVANLPDGSSAKARALNALNAAEFQVRKLQAEYDWYTGKPTETDAAIVRANLDAARAMFEEAGWYLSALKGEPVPPEATGPQLTQLQQAKDNLKATQDRLDHTRLVAPFSGAIAAIHIRAGEFASPGQTIVVVMDTERFQVETTDLGERQIADVKNGDEAIIRIGALNQQFEGTVTSISPMANTLGGDVVYKVTIVFNENPEGVLSGMSVDVDILTR
ncbi:MAG: efflux RND transporter periplasmic adaptor subunit [Anaerolineales bacterium]|nr:MAG: efflux RND transporter periplasmic adaptor subunit [Anaerolineales bacterium]